MQISGERADLIEKASFKMQITILVLTNAGALVTLIASAIINRMVQ